MKLVSTTGLWRSFMTSFKSQSHLAKLQTPNFSLPPLSKMSNTTSVSDVSSTAKLNTASTGLTVTKYGVMPPLLYEESLQASREYSATKYLGFACENLVAQYETSRLNNIANPQIDDGTDLLIKIKDGEWERGQVKKVVRSTKQGRNSFAFFFNSTKSGSVARKSTGYDVEWFYHVILTPHRQLLFKTPNSVVPLNSAGTGQVMCIDLVLDRPNRVHSKNKALDMKDHLVYSLYSPMIMRAFPDFSF